jgi:hypothetical protein
MVGIAVKLRVATDSVALNIKLTVIFEITELLGFQPR